MSDKPLTLGMVGKNVAALHQALSERGFAIAEAETQKQFFGPATRMAVGEFQKANGIDPSCEVCKKTADQLKTTLIANDLPNYSQSPVKTLVSQVGITSYSSQPPVKNLTSRVGAATNYNQLVQTFSSQVGTEQQPSQPNAKRKMPTHLSVFALAKSTGHPIARMPFYAEVGVVSVLPQPKCNLPMPLQEAIRDGIIRLTPNEKKFSPKAETDFKKIIQGLSNGSLIDLLCDRLCRLLAPKVIEKWVSDHDSAASAVVQILQTASELAKDRNMDWNNPQMLGSLLEEAILAYATRNNLPKAEANAPESRIVWAHPLGVLATDHVGYLSFDLTRLPQDVAEAVALALETRRRDPNTPTATSIWIYPMAQEERRIDALEQMRFADDAIVVRLGLDVELDPELCQPKLCDSIKNLGIAAMQNPDLTDWRLSPGSFATNPGMLVGADGCETILPANVALQEFYFYQVIRLTDLQDAVPATLRNQIKLGVVHEYRIAWHHLGHSLGQILYSLPLAPGESVNLAVIDWSRRDDASRKEDTKLDERLVHSEHRDRTISETVDAAVNEFQHGSSFMGGVAGSVGGAIGAAGTGAAAGISGGLGGATSNSSGTRTLAGDTVQKLSDNIIQVSSAMRELQSTVVVHSTQSEKEAIETRTVVNYNHSHALTILYYEVLRHFRITTELVRQRPAVLVKLNTDWFDETDSLGHPIPHIQVENILEYRDVLQAALLNPRYAEGFNAIERLNHQNFNRPLPLPPKQDIPTSPAGPEFRFFVFDMLTGGMSANLENNQQDITVDARLWPTGIILEGAGGRRLSHPGAFTGKDANNSFVGHVPGGKTVFWGDIHMIAIKCHQQNTDVSFRHIKVTAIDVDGHKNVLVDKNYVPGDLVLTNDWWIDLPTERPQPLPPPPPYYAAADVADHAKGMELLAHLQKHKQFYSRAIFLSQNPVLRASYLDSIEFPDDRSTALEHLDNRPLEIVGDYVAYPSTDGAWNRKIKQQIKLSLEKQPDDADPPELDDADSFDERLVTLPTRGVFAEAKLGHCNASEEIDPNRFWKWEEHPIPHSAPEIAAIEAGKHTVINPNLQSTPFPQSLVNIVNPPNAPDPTGLASAMNVLATSNIFRDMSGRAEVADLLKKLSDNSVAIAGVAQKAATGGAGKGVTGGGASTGGVGSGSVGGGANTGSSLGSGSKSSGSGSSSGSAGQRPATPGTPQTVAEVNDLASGIRNHLSPAQANPMLDKLYQNAVDNAVGEGAGTEELDLQPVGDTYTPSAMTPNELNGLVGELVLAESLERNGLIVFRDQSKHVSATGIDLTALDPKTLEVWLLDNKAQMDGIGKANALTGDKFESYKNEVIEFLEKRSPHPQAHVAAQSLKQKKYVKVAANAWAGADTRFTKGLFEKQGLKAYDIRMGKLFSKWVDWEQAFKNLPKGIRRLGMRGTAILDASLLVLAVVETTLYVVSNREELGKAIGEFVAETVFGSVLSRLPGGFIAGLVIGMESDESPGQLAARKRNETIDSICLSIAGFDKMSVSDQDKIREEIGKILDEPLKIEVPKKPGQLLPGLDYDSWKPRTDWT